MFVCICNAIRDTELHKAALECGGSAEEIYHHLGKPPQCGMCLGEAEAILQEARDPARQVAIV